MNILYDAPKEVIDFFETMATKVDEGGGETYYYMPYWFKKTEVSKFQMVKFEELPTWVTDLIKANRDGV